MKEKLATKLSELNARIEDLKSENTSEDWDYFEPFDRGWRSGFREALIEQKKWIEGLMEL